MNPHMYLSYLYFLSHWDMQLLNNVCYLKACDARKRRIFADYDKWKHTSINSFSRFKNSYNIEDENGKKY